MALTYNGCEPEFLSAAPTNLLDTHLKEIPEATEYIYIVAAHKRPNDFAPAWEDDIQSADLVFHEQAQWLPQYRLDVQQIANGSTIPFSRLTPGTYSYRKYEAVLGSRVRQDFWDVKAGTPEAESLPDLDVYHAHSDKADNLMRKGKDEEALESMTCAKTILARWDEIRDLAAIQRITKQTAAYEVGHQARNKDTYRIVVLAGLAHIYQAVALEYSLRAGPKDIKIKSQFEEKAMHVGNAPYAEYLAGLPMSFESVAKSWLLTRLHIRDSVRFTTRNAASIDNNNANRIIDMDHDEVIKRIRQTLPKN